MSQRLPAQNMFYALTNDLLVEVFDTYLFANMCRDVFPYQKYYQRLAKLCAVCPDWRNFLVAQPRFWIYILITSYYPEEAILTHLDRADTLDLCFRFEFMTYHWPQVTAHVHARVACVLPYIIRARSLFAQCSTPEKMHALHSVLSDCNAPRLRALILRFVHRGRHNLTSIAIHPAVVRRWLSADFGNLEVLKTACTLLPFHSFTFPHLRSFHIHGANPQYSMDIGTFAHIMRSSPQLIQLGIRCLSFSGFNDDHAPAFIFAPTITCLHLAFSLDHTISELIRRIRIPHLVELNVVLSGDSDVADLVSCSSSLNNITSLTIVIPVVRRAPDTTAVLPCFPALTFLDLRTAACRVFFDALRASQNAVVDGVTSVMPRLSKLLLPSVSAEAIKSFAMLHGATDSIVDHHIRLKHIQVVPSIYYGPATVTTTDHREWIHLRVANFSIGRDA
ncbi:hypothetical protein C8R43DRAFT_1130948 [Mycena crocata]|nr:hypothetical protein C8R43DRAFT_1130948 [Mycena crocata]